MKSHEHIFTGSAKHKQYEYELYLASCFMSEQDLSLKNTFANLNCDRFLEDSAEIPQDLAEAFRQKIIPCSDVVQNLIHKHYQSLCKTWRPERNSYISLGKMYSHHQSFKNYFDKFEPDLADFIAEAMKVYAEHKL